MSVDYEFMKSSYECIKDVTCDKCDVHTSQKIMSTKRHSNNAVYFCPAPEKTAVKKGLSKAQRGKDKK